MDLWRILPVSLLPKSDAPLKFDAASRELAEPQKLLPYLLQLEVNNLPPDIVSMYVQSMTKIFGFWASELGQRWNDDELPELKRTVMSIQDRVGEFAVCQDIEVQERVRSLLCSLLLILNNQIIRLQIHCSCLTLFLLISIHIYRICGSLLRHHCRDPLRSWMDLLQDLMNSDFRKVYISSIHFSVLMSLTL